MGLTESKEGGKNSGKAQRADRHLGTLLESTLNQLDAEDRIRRIEKPGQFGANLQERLYNVASSSPSPGSTASFSSNYGSPAHKLP